MLRAALVAVLLLALGVGATAPTCYPDTSAALIVDSSASSTSKVPLLASLWPLLGDPKTGTVLGFSQLTLATWQYAANAPLTFDTIHQLSAAMPYAVVTDNRGAATGSNDYKFMFDSLTQAINDAKAYGVIYVIGDEDQLCDGGRSEFAADNAVVNAGVATLVTLANSKHVSVSFFYPFGSDPTTEPEGCADGDRSTVQAGLQSIADQTGGTATFGGAEAPMGIALATAVEAAGTRPAECSRACATNPKLGLVLDTSSTSAQHYPTEKARALVSALYDAAPFEGYVLSTWAAPANAPKEFDSLADLDSLLPPLTFNQRVITDTYGEIAGNDWKYMVESLEYMLPKVGLDAVIVVLSDEEALCDVHRFADNYAERLQLVVNAAVAKHVHVSFYYWADGDGGSHSALLDCTLALQQKALSVAAAMVSITGGHGPTSLDGGWPVSIGEAAAHVVSEAVVEPSHVPHCNVCLGNTTLTLVVDSSVSMDPHKESIRTFFQSLVAVPLHSFDAFSTYLLSTWKLHYDEILAFNTTEQMNDWVQLRDPDSLASRRWWYDPMHTHDDWNYTLMTLGVVVNMTGPNGVLAVVADDNQLCECEQWNHQWSELEPIVADAVRLNVSILYYSFATPNRWCSDATKERAKNFARKVAELTHGLAYFGNDPFPETIEKEFADLRTQIVQHSHKPVCPSPCPHSGELWNGVGCEVDDPCAGNPCVHDTCVSNMAAKSFTCSCSSQYFGSGFCEFGCIPVAGVGVKPFHELGLVVDTSDSSHGIVNGLNWVKAHLPSTMVPFDNYFLSTWAFTSATGLVQSYGSVSAMMAAATDPANLVNNRLSAGDHNDWLYMLDSVDAMLDAMGDDSAILIVADLEQLCDANPAARMVGSDERYMSNPLPLRMATINGKALAHHIKLYYYVFPSYNNGNCHASEKPASVDAVHTLVDGTGGLFAGVPMPLSTPSLFLVTEELLTSIKGESNVNRCT